MKKLFKKTKHYLEYLAFLLVTSLLRLVSIDRSADICAFITRKICLYLPVTRIARNNLRRFYGIKNQEEEDRIIEGLWDNFGRFIGEFPHIHSLSLKELEARVEITGLENIKELQDSGKPFLLFSGHFANWDIILPILQMLYPQFGVIYRKANNHLVGGLIDKWREYPNISLIPKGPSGGKGLIKSIKLGHSIAMLVDQKMNDGIPVPFFGANAMTPPAIAKFALQFNYPIIPVQIIRKKGSYFKVVLHQALKPQVTGDSQADVLNIMCDINRIFEGWIRERPEQWFWFHNRWGKG